MMSDLALLGTDRGDFDLAIEGGELLGDDGLMTAVTVSLFSDRLAREDDPLPESMPGRVGDRRGWWGDLVRLDGRANPIGSRLWLLNREKELQETVNRAAEYATEGLAWLKALGGDFSVAASDERPGRLRLNIEVKALGPARKTDKWTAFVDYGQPRAVSLKGVY